MHPDIVMMHLLYKGFMEDYMCWYAYRELFVCNKSMWERVVGSTSSPGNVHEVANENSNLYVHVCRHFAERCINIYWKCHNHRRLYRRIQPVSISQRVAKIFTRNATITDESTDGYILSALYKELQKYLL
jgi:hypothetical protein